MGKLFQLKSDYQPTGDQPGAIEKLSTNLANGVKEEIDKNGFLGIFTGGITATSAGITAAIVFGYLGALISKSNIKK